MDKMKERKEGRNKIRDPIILKNYIKTGLIRTIFTKRVLSTVQINKNPNLFIYLLNEANNSIRSSIFITAVSDFLKQVI
jgi:hypothetical protein